MVVNSIATPNRLGSSLNSNFTKHSTATRPTGFLRPLKKHFHLNLSRRQQIQARQNNANASLFETSTSELSNSNPYYPGDQPSHLPQFLSTPTTPQIPMPPTTASGSTSQRDKWSLSIGKKDQTNEDTADEMGSEFDFVSSLDAGSSPIDDHASSWTPSHASTSSNTPGSPDSEDPLMTDVILNFQSKQAERLLSQFSDPGKRSNGYVSEDNLSIELHDSSQRNPSDWLALSSRASTSQTRASSQHKSFYQSRTGSGSRAIKQKSTNHQTKRTSASSYRRNVQLPTSQRTSSSYTSSGSGGSSNGTGSNTRKRHLLQFIVDLLNGPQGQTCVQWISRTDKIFRICDPNELTHMWGVYKNNMNMSFESLSRSLRLYYAPGKLERIQGRRHQYRLISGISWPGRT